MAHLQTGQELGGTVRKGEKGTAIVFYKQLHGKKADEGDQTEEKGEEQTGQIKDRSPFVLTSYIVFNVEQCDGLKLPEMLPASEPNDFETDQACENLVQGWKSRPSLQLLSQTERRAYYHLQPTPYTCRHASALWSPASTTAPSSMNWPTAPDMRPA